VEIESESERSFMKEAYRKYVKKELMA